MTLLGIITPTWYLFTIVAAFCIALFFIIYNINKNLLFQKLCEKAAIKKEFLDFIKENYSNKRLLRKSRLIEKVAIKVNSSVLIETGLCKLWENKVKGIFPHFYIKKILTFFPERGLFVCLKNADSKKIFIRFFNKYSSKVSDENFLKKMAIAGNGEDFNGELAVSILNPNIDEIFELTGNQEWYIRFFAVKLLLTLNEERSNRFIWECFNDSSKNIRQIVINEFKTENTEKITNKLINLVLNDPTESVRKFARNRMAKDYPESYKIKIKSLSKVQILHIIDQLIDDSKNDEKLAFDFLEYKDLEIQSKAALFLQKQGKLTKLFESSIVRNKRGREAFENVFLTACELNITSFFEGIKNTHNPESLLLASKLLLKVGNPEYISYLAERVFSPTFKLEYKEYYLEIYKNTITCISFRGNEDSLNLLNSELKKQYKDPHLSSIILTKLPDRGDFIFLPTLLSILKIGDYLEKPIFRKAIEKYPPYLYFEEISNILSSSKKEHKYEVKKEALKILGELNLPYCIQIVLENLKLLSNEEQREFSIILDKYEENIFIERCKVILKSSDFETRAALITSIPSNKLNIFIEDIIEATTDSDPDIRIAAIWSLGRNKATKHLSNLTNMLRDPIKRVRKEAAYILSEFGNKKALDSISNIISDDNEVFEIKQSAIVGLGYAKGIEPIEILASNICSFELEKSIIKALSLKTSTSELEHLIKIYKNSSSQNKEKLSKVFINMGMICEKNLLMLLNEENISQNLLIAEILNKMGFIDKNIAKLKHRKVEERKKVAECLVSLKIKPAYRGLILATRDPSLEVRMVAINAFENLNGLNEKKILNELKEDPDKRVRKYSSLVIGNLENKNES